MDTFVDERDYRLLEGDPYTFFVLRRILGEPHTLLLTDHERTLLCFSRQPFPVWIWTPDDITEEELEQTYLLAKENELMDGEHRFNIKYVLAEYFIKRAAADGLALKIETNMFAYDCPASIKPSVTADGALYQCTEDDIDELVEMRTKFHEAIDADYESAEAYRAKAEEGVRNGGMYFWKNAAGRTVSCCTWKPSGAMASVGLVYTREEARRRHYAENMVYQVTEITRQNGFLPILYTDADYAASNACYEKIGYVLRGKLCTVAKA